MNNWRRSRRRRRYYLRKFVWSNTTDGHPRLYYVFKIWTRQYEVSHERLHLCVGFGHQMWYTSEYKKITLDDKVA